MTNDIDNLISTSYQKGKKYFSDRIQTGKLPICCRGFVGGTCKGGHRFASLQFCGREYCKDCQRDGSPIHQRRVNKWSIKTADWSVMGYMVVTIPESVRHYFYDKQQLRDFRSKLLRKLKDTYSIHKGLARWHWFGDCVNCSGKGCIYCKHTGAGDTWHPHLNILFPSIGFIEDVELYLAPLKIWMAQYIQKIIRADIESHHAAIMDGSDESMGVVDHLLDVSSTITAASLVINYSFVRDDKMKMNRIKYVTRSTFKRFDQSCRDMLYNFRNCVVWGWSKTDAVEDDDHTDRLCPICEAAGQYSTIHWSRLSKFNNKHTLTKIKKHEQNQTGNSDHRGYIYALGSSEGGTDQHHHRDPDTIQITGIIDGAGWSRGVHKDRVFSAI